MHIKQDRRCVACRASKNQKLMLRVTRFNDEYLIDEMCKLDGRGAYVCKNAKCIQLAIKKRLFNKSFKCNLSNDIYEKLGEYEKNY